MSAAAAADLRGERGAAADKGPWWSRWRLTRLVMKWSAAIVAPPGRPWATGRWTVVGGGDVSVLSRRNGRFVAFRQYLLQWFSGSPRRVSLQNLSPAAAVSREAPEGRDGGRQRVQKMILVIIKSNLK